MSIATLRAPFNLKRNVSFAIAEFAINLVLVFFSYRLIIMRGGLEAVGVWSVLFAWTSLVRLGDVGMANATLRFVSLHDARKEPQRLADYVETGVLTNLVFFAVLSCLGYVIMSPFVPEMVGATHAQEARAILPIMFCGFWLLNVSGAVLGALQGLHLGYVRSLISVGGTMVQLVAVLVLVPELGLGGLALAQVLQYALISIVGWGLVVKNLAQVSLLPVRFKPAAFRDMLGYSLKAQMANVASGLFEPVSKILIGHFGGLQMQGLYELAFKSVWLPRNGVIAGVSATLPAMTSLSTRQGDKLQQIYERCVGMTALAVSLLMLAVLCASPIVSMIWIGSLRFDYCAMVFLLGCGAIFSAWAAAAYNLAFATGDMRANLVANTVVLALLVGLGGLLGRVATPWAVLIVVPVLMSVHSIWIKHQNEGLLGRLA